MTKTPHDHRPHGDGRICESDETYLTRAQFHEINCSCGDCIGFRAGVLGAKRGYSIADVQAPISSNQQAFELLFDNYVAVLHECRVGACAPNAVIAKQRQQRIDDARTAVIAAAFSGDSSAPDTPADIGMDLGMNTPWPLRDVLAKLVQATDHLLTVHSCDTHGHEEFRRAVIRGREYLSMPTAGPSAVTTAPQPMSHEELTALCKRFMVQGYHGDYLENDGFDLAREVEGITLNRLQRLPAETSKQPPLHLNAYQLKQALDLCDGEDDSELAFLKYAEDRHEPGEHGDPMPAGTYCWFPEYPEEGQLLLKEERPEESPETSKDVTPEFAAEFEREIVRKVLKDVEGITEGRTELFWAGMSLACEEATHRLEEIWKGLPTSAGSAQETAKDAQCDCDGSGRSVVNGRTRLCSVHQPQCKPLEMPVCPKCQAMRKLGLRSCLQHR